MKEIQPSQENNKILAQYIKIKISKEMQRKRDETDLDNIINNVPKILIR